MSATAGVLAAAAQAGRIVDELVLTGVRDVHHAVSDRAWAVQDRLSGGRTASHRIHDGVTAMVYGGVGSGLRGAARALDAVDRRGAGARLEDSASGRLLVSAVNGLIGDRLRDEGSALSFEMTVRHGQRDVEPTREGLASVFAEATGSVVVFVHGLCESEQVWHRSRRPRREGPAAPEPGSYGDRLAQEGWTPVYIRLNTGVSVAENGVALAALLSRLTRAWPTDVDRLALIGHSMGGLVIRTAGAVSQPVPQPLPQPGSGAWTDLVTDVVTLGTPHLGAPLERVVARSTPWLGRLREVAPLGRVLDARSAGILDLRHGLAPGVPHFPHARYRLVAGSLTRSPRHPVAMAVGDLLVQPRSALGSPRRAAPVFPDADLLHVPGAGHFDLLNHDDVYAALRRWLSES